MGLPRSAQPDVFGHAEPKVDAADLLKHRVKKSTVSSEAYATLSMLSAIACDMGKHSLARELANTTFFNECRRPADSYESIPRGSLGVIAHGLAAMEASPKIEIPG